MPWLPPSLGSWNELIRALLHDPFLGSGHEPPHPYSVMREGRQTAAADPQPSPWGPGPDPWRYVVGGFVAAVNVQVLASQVRDETARKEIEESAGRTIAQLLDDYCGTRPRWPWPWPGPPPWVFAIAAELNAIASTLPEGEMRSGLQALAGQVAAKGVEAGQSVGRVA